MTTPRDSKVLATYRQRLNPAEKNIERHRPRFIENYRVYRAWSSRNQPDRAEWQHDLRTPHIYQQLETIFPRLVDPDPAIEFLPREPGDAERALASRRLVNDQLHRDGFAIKQLPFIKPAGVFGLSWGKVTHDHRIIRRRVRLGVEDMMQRAQMIAEQTGTSMEEAMQYVEAVEYEDRTLKDDPTFTVCNALNMMWDPAATNDGPLEQTCEYIIHRSYVPLQKLRREEKRKLQDGREVGVYSNLDEVKDTGSSPKGNSTLPNSNTEENRARQDLVQVDELWMPHHNKLIVVANGMTIIRYEDEYPYDHMMFPFVCVTLQPDVYSFAGISEVEPLQPTQDALWMNRNQRLDNMQLGMDIVLLVKSSIDNPNDLVIQPGAKWPVDHPDDVVPLQLPQVPVASYQEDQALKGELQDIGGVSPYLSGADAGASGVNNDTATGMLSIQQEANKRIEVRLMQLRKQGWERVALLFHETNKQHLSEERAVRIAGEAGHDFVTVGPDDLIGEFDIEARFSNDTLGKAVRQRASQDLLVALQPYMQAPLPGGKTINLMPVLKMVAEAHDMEMSALVMDLAEAQAATAAPDMAMQEMSGDQAIQQQLLAAAMQPEQQFEQSSNGVSSEPAGAGAEAFGEG